MKRTKYIITGLFSLFLLSSINNAHTEPYNLAIKKLDKRFDTKYWDYENPVTSTEKNFTYYVPLHKSRLISLDERVKKISKGDPGLANILLFPPNQLFIQGLRLGTTNVMVWGANNKINHIINIEVTHDLESLKAKLYELLPNEEIHVRSVQKNIVLSGQITGLPVMQAAIDIAQSFLGGSSSLNKSSKGTGSGGGVQVNTGNKKDRKEKSKGDVPHVINLMSVGGAQQVMLKVTIAEIDRKVLRGLDVKFNATDISNFGGASIFGGQQFSLDSTDIFLSVISGDWLLSLRIEAAENQQLAKILAEPVLTTLSGQQATFISGGEFPIPVPQSSGTGGGSTITIEFKEFGITTRFLPVVLDSGRINLNVNLGVSELSEDAAIVSNTGIFGGPSFSIPSLTKREASSTVELADGQTMSIAGLISDKVRSNVRKFPGLGDIPVLGALFRSESFIKSQTELVMFITPHLAKPILAKDAKLPTDSYIEPDDLDFYLLGRLESRNAKSIVENNNLYLNNSTGGLEGHFGHQLIEEDNTL